jgi:hypothetical protein
MPVKALTKSAAAIADVEHATDHRIGRLRR